MQRQEHVKGVGTSKATSRAVLTAQDLDRAHDDLEDGRGPVDKLTFIEDVLDSMGYNRK